MGIHKIIISEKRHGLVWLIKQKRKTTTPTADASSERPSCVWSCASICATTAAISTTTLPTTTLPTTTLPTTTLSTTTLSTATISTTLSNCTEFNQCATNSSKRDSSLQR